MSLCQSLVALDGMLFVNVCQLFDLFQVARFISLLISSGLAWLLISNLAKVCVARARAISLGCVFRISFLPLYFGDYFCFVFIEIGVTRSVIVSNIF